MFLDYIVLHCYIYHTTLYDAGPVFVFVVCVFGSVPLPDQVSDISDSSVAVHQSKPHNWNPILEQVSEVRVKPTHGFERFGRGCCPTCRSGSKAGFSGFFGSHAHLQRTTQHDIDVLCSTCRASDANICSQPCFLVCKRTSLQYRT